MAAALEGLRATKPRRLPPDLIGRGSAGPHPVQHDRTAGLSRAWRMWDSGSFAPAVARVKMAKANGAIPTGLP